VPTQWSSDRRSVPDRHPSCCNLIAVIAWSIASDAIGRRWIINVCQTFCVLILFTVGGLWWTGATSGNAAAGTALVSLNGEIGDLSGIFTDADQLVICCLVSHRHLLLLTV
jgi:hypothetical protein